MDLNISFRFCVPSAVPATASADQSYRCDKLNAFWWWNCPESVNGWIPTFLTSGIVHHNPKSSPWKPTCKGGSVAQQREHGMQTQALYACKSRPGPCGLHDNDQGYRPFRSPGFLIRKSGRWIPSLQVSWKDWKIIYARGLLEQWLSYSTFSITETDKIMPMTSSTLVSFLLFCAKGSKARTQVPYEDIPGAFSTYPLLETATKI